MKCRLQIKYAKDKEGIKYGSVLLHRSQ